VVVVVVSDFVVDVVDVVQIVVVVVVSLTKNRRKKVYDLKCSNLSHTQIWETALAKGYFFVKFRIIKKGKIITDAQTVSSINEPIF
jgi:hypothetical protein